MFFRVEDAFVTGYLAEKVRKYHTRELRNEKSVGAIETGDPARLPAQLAG